MTVSWRNRSLELCDANNRQWLTAPLGGESISALIERVATWFAGVDAQTGQLVAVTHQSVIRAALIHVLDAPPQSFWRIDVPPLAIVDLTSNGKRWALAFRGGM